MEDYKKLYEQTQKKMEEFIKRWDGIKLSSNDQFTKELKQIVEIESEDEKIRKKIVAALSYYRNEGCMSQTECNECKFWLEKQAEKKGNNKLIWKHWKNGIAGNGEGEPIYLTKVGNTHSLSSCLGFECDYIELSELDNLMFEKQGEQKPAEWSEEDESYLNTTISYLKDAKEFKKSAENCINWLKSLKDRVQSQTNITDEELAQAKNNAYNDALDKTEYNSDWPTFDDGWSAAIWYLKKRNVMPQRQWKPSKEQIGALNYAYCELFKRKDVGHNILGPLQELCDELKKL